MNLSHLAIRRIVGTLVITVLFCGLGVFFLSGQSVDLLPQITYPLVKISVTYPGASPEEIENNITRPLETLVAASEDSIKTISTITEGQSLTEVYFKYGTDMEAALNEVRSRLDRLTNLPDEVERPVVRKADPSQLPVLDLGLASNQRDEVELNSWADKELSKLFMGIEGLAGATVSGGKVREIAVVFSPEELARHELTVAQIIASLARENVDIPGGYITAGKREITVRLAARYGSLDDIRNVVVADREGVPIRLAHVARVIDSYADQRVIVRVNGKPSVLLSFLKQPTANTVAVCEAIKKKIAALKAQGLIPADVESRVVNDQSYYIRNSISSVGGSFLVGGVLAVLVTYFFLGSIVKTLIVAIAVPVPLLVTFFLMGLFGITINMMSLGGLVVGVGMLLDNSIVMLENITRHQKNKTDLIAAAEEGSAEVGSAVAASTLTNLASVLPFLLISGLAVLLFRDLILTISIAITASLLVALTVVPALAARLTKYSSNRSGFSDRLNHWMTAVYLRALKPALKHRWLVIAVLLAAAVVCFFLWKSAGSEFLPQIDDGRATISIKLPEGTALGVTDQLARELESELAEKNGDIETIYSSVGGFWLSGRVNEYSNQAQINVQLKSRGKRKKSTVEFIKGARQIIKGHKSSGAEFKVVQSKLRGLRLGAAQEAVELKLFGPEIPRLRKYAAEIMARIEKVKGITNLNLSLDLSRPEMHIELDRKKMSDFGLSALQVGSALRATLYGSVATRYTDPRYGEDFDIRVLYDRDKFTGLDAVRNLTLQTPAGFAVRLGEIGKVTNELGPASIERENQSRLIRVLADAEPGISAGQLTAAVKQELAGYQLSEPYRLEIGGDAESMAESNRLMLTAAILALFLVFGIMAVQFESLRDPLVIMFTIPFALMGAIFSLVVTGTPFSTVVFLAIILLIGVAVNNGIVMVNYFGVLRREQGKSVYEAVLEGAPTRLRPVLMTGISAIFGLIPLSLGLSEGSELLVPLGISVIGGMLLATLLTLFVIPSVYLIINPEREKHLPRGR